MKLGLSLAVALLAIPVSLFSLAGCETLDSTPGENGNHMVHAISTNGSQFVEDSQILGLVDRPSYLSPKPIPDQFVNYERVYPKGTPYYFKDNP